MSSQRKIYAIIGIFGSLGLISAVLIKNPDILRSKPGSAGLGIIPVTSPYIFSFNAPGVLKEAGSMLESSSPYWWLNSGGQLTIEDGVGKTIEGEAPIGNLFRLLYFLSNPIDTDNGTHPQNIFRLISRSMWGDVRLQADFKITGDNWSKSPNKNGSNGLLLMSHYLNSDTFYYAGLRVDGTAVVKKKYHGTYYTMGRKKIFPGNYKEGDNKNLIPHDEWLAIRSEILTNPDGSVTIRLFYFRPLTQKNWMLLLETRDKKNFGGTPPITEPGFAGIRTDFMDVMFRAFKAETIPS